jgi:hypothetical protein
VKRPDHAVGGQGDPITKTIETVEDYDLSAGIMDPAYKRTVKNAASAI